MSYKITITNNEDGKVLVNEENGVAIVGAIANKEDTSQIGFTCANAFTVASAIDSAEEVISKLKNKNPQVGLLLALAAASKRGVSDEN